MARLFGDGFDHYGSDESNLLDGVYATATNVELSTEQFATGTHSVKFTATDFGATTGLRKVLPSAIDKMGAMARFYFPNMATENYECAIFDFLTSVSTTAQITCFVDANGVIRFTRGATNGGSADPGTLIAQTDPIVVASAWNHIEVQVYIHDTAGWVRVAVNGVHRYQATGLDTKTNSDNIVSVANHRKRVNTSDGDYYMDDLIYYDFTGTAATDTDFCPTVDGSGIGTNYIGELQGMWLPPNGNTTEDDWLKSTGVSAFALVDETTPDDADYIYSTAAADLTELSLTDLPAEITYVRGLDIWGRMSKSDSGAAMVKFGMKSVASTIDAAERPVTVEPTYWWDQENIDPNTGAATGTLTFTGQPANGETLTIGAKVYTFQTVLTNSDGNVLIGANLAASISNLAAAINLGAGSGTVYAAATTLNTQVTAVANATTLVITAKVSGTSGNSIGTTETIANASWGGATMSGGSAGTRWTRANLNAAWMRLTRSA